MSTRGRRVAAVAVAVALAVVAGGGYAWWRLADTRGTWSASVAAVPDLSAWPAELRERVADLASRAAGREAAALGELSRLYHANGFLREAALAYVGLERIEPAHARWPHRFAHLLAGMGRLEDAVPRWQRATALAPEYGPAHVRLGDALLKINHPTAAAAAYAAALALTPEDPYALFGLARCEMQLGRWTAARERLQQAAAAQPEFGAAWNLLATVHQRLGNDAGAAGAQAQAERKRRFREMPDPWVDELLEDCYDSYRLRVVAAVAIADADPAGAMRWLERAARIAPDSAAVHRDLGDVLVALHDYPRARAELERATALAPTDEHGHLSLIACHVASGDVDGALRVAEAGVEHCPEAAGLWFALGRQRAAAGRLEDALVAFAAARRLQPETPDAYHEIAGICFRLGRGAEGVAVLEDALAHVPGHIGTVLALAQRAIETGDEAVARRWLGVARASGSAGAEGVEPLLRDFERRFGRAR